MRRMRGGHFHAHILALSQLRAPGVFLINRKAQASAFTSSVPFLGTCLLSMYMAQAGHFWMLRSSGQCIIGCPEANPDHPFKPCIGHSRATCAQRVSVHGPAVSPSCPAESAPTPSSFCHSSVSLPNFARAIRDLTARQIPPLGCLVGCSPSSSRIAHRVVPSALETDGLKT
ncbi:hypothetical protein C8Q70DRAFT_652460 [Cubamyces menziesii]|nr:hypothetical protein C8Q70DRAFT_652460 [Cubamyces menziesii]